MLFSNYQIALSLYGESGVQVQQLYARWAIILGLIIAGVVFFFLVENVLHDEPLEQDYVYDGHERDASGQKDHVVYRGPVAVVVQRHEYFDEHAEPEQYERDHVQRLVEAD